MIKFFYLFKLLTKMGCDWYAIKYYKIKHQTSVGIINTYITISRDCRYIYITENDDDDLEYNDIIDMNISDYKKTNLSKLIYKDNIWKIKSKSKIDSILYLINKDNIDVEKVISIKRTSDGEIRY